MKDSAREKVREIERKKCAGIVTKWSSRVLAPPLKSPVPLSITTWSDRQYMKIFRCAGKRSAQQLARALASSFHLNDASCVAQEIQQESKQRSFITCLLPATANPPDLWDPLFIKSTEGSVQSGEATGSSVRTCVCVCVFSRRSFPINSMHV